MRFLPSHLHAAWVEFRNRKISNPAFQRWASRFPLTRPIANKSARDSFALVAGFVHTQVLLMAVESGLLAALKCKSRTLSELSAELDFSQAVLPRILRATSSLRLTEPLGEDRYALGDLGAALVGTPGAVNMIRHHPILYDDLRDPTGLLCRDNETTNLSAFWSYVGGDAEKAEKEGTESYSHLMAATQEGFIDEVLLAYPFEKHARHLDIGGGHGVFVSALASHAPQLTSHLIDLPSVASVASSRFADLGVSERCTAAGVNFYEEAFPAGFDLATLIRVCFDHNDQAVLTIFEKTYDALVPGGKLLVAEPMASEAQNDPIADAYFNLYLLAMRGGRTRTYGEFAQMLSAAKFSKIQRLANPVGLLTRFIVAEKRKQMRHFV